MLSKLELIREKKEDLVPRIVQNILNQEYWAGIKFRTIYDSLLASQDISPEEYKKRHSEEFRNILKSAMKNETDIDYGLSKLFQSMEDTAESTRKYIEDNLLNLDLEYFQRTFELQGLRFQYQQKDYRERLLSVIGENFSDKFGINDLGKLLDQVGKSTQIPQHLKNNVELLVRKGKLKRSKVKQRIFYQV
mgnify:CR=1 FL=1